MSDDGTGVKMEATGPGDDTMSGYLNSFLIWAARNPYTFLFYVLAVLSPFFVVSALLSWKLSKALEKQEKEMKRRKATAAKAAKAKKDT